MGRLFGTDGIRGVANLEPMTSEMAMKVGRAAAHVFLKRKGRHQIIIGKDTRISGYMLESALTAGLCSMGVDVLLVGPLPTPAIAFLTRSLRADAGVMISAFSNFGLIDLKYSPEARFTRAFDPDCRSSWLRDLVMRPSQNWYRLLPVSVSRRVPISSR